jgi:hypothetical protein
LQSFKIHLVANGPVDQVQVKVLESKIFQCELTSRDHHASRVVRVPQLKFYKNVSMNFFLYFVISFSARKFVKEAENMLPAKAVLIW